VVGFDDILLASHTIPALTTLRMPTAEIVNEGVRLAIELARGPAAPRPQGVTVMRPSLIVRQSTAPPPAS
jgi:DNA-binding LacI/PurR family transcriptional regulator